MLHLPDCRTTPPTHTYLTLPPVPPLPPPHLPQNAQGNAVVVGRKSPYSLYDPVIASFEDDKGLYNQADAGGFIKLQALRLRTLGVNRNR